MGVIILNINCVYAALRGELGDLELRIQVLLIPQTDITQVLYKLMARPVFRLKKNQLRVSNQVNKSPSHIRNSTHSCNCCKLVLFVLR